MPPYLPLPQYLTAGNTNPMFVQSRSPTILITRPEAQSQRFASQIRERCGPVSMVISPLMAPEYFIPHLPDKTFSAIAFTSETAVESARRISAAGVALPSRAYCVGRHTADAARAAGFASHSADGDVDNLFDLIRASRLTGSLLYFRGNDSVGDLKNTLNLAGIETYSVTTYRQKSLAFNLHAKQILTANSPVIVPLFSPRSAQLFLSELRRVDATSLLWVAALSANVAATFVAQPIDRLQIAVDPNGKAMLDAVELLIDCHTGS